MRFKYNGHDAGSVHTFLSGSGRTGKFSLLKLIYNAISKTLCYHWQNLEKPGILLLWSTRISAVNVGRTSTFSFLGIEPGTKLGLNDKSKAALRNRLSKVKVLVIDKIFMVSSDLWTDIGPRSR